MQLRLQRKNEKKLKDPKRAPQAVCFESVDQFEAVINKTASSVVVAMEEKFIAMMQAHLKDAYSHADNLFHDLKDEISNKVPVNKSDDRDLSALFDDKIAKIVRGFEEMKGDIDELKTEAAVALDDIDELKNDVQTMDNNMDALKDVVQHAFEELTDGRITIDFGDGGSTTSEGSHEPAPKKKKQGNGKNKG